MQPRACQRDPFRDEERDGKEQDFPFLVVLTMPSGLDRGILLNSTLNYTLSDAVNEVQ